MSYFLIILPAFNEQTVLADTIKGVRQSLSKQKGKYKILVVNDGSKDETNQIALAHADLILTHRHNRGLGAALATGLMFAKRDQAVLAALTFDADGQHNARDIKAALNKIIEGYDVVVGSRFLQRNDIPPFRKIILKFSNLITILFFGVRTTDSQSGFRAFSRRAIDNLELSSNRMEVSSEVFSEIRRHHLKYGEIPIHVSYTPYSLQKGQSNLNSMNILVKLFYILAR